MVRAANERAQARHEAGARVARTLQLRLPHSIGADEVGALVTGALLGGYRFVVSAQPAPPSIGTLRLIAGEDAVDRLAEVVRTASTLAAATALARDLANTPSNVKTPRWLAGQAIRAVGGLPGMTAIEHDERWLAEHGFGGVLAVGGGSASPPRLIELRWRPRGSAKAPHLVLVGKGITFDTGGISLKPADGMHLMRTDMAGGAAVIAAMRAIGTLRLPLRVTALVPAAENHVSGSAYRPGDVVRHYGGITTEVSNTDAEGRLVLADALAYACARLRPGHIVDVATLTGAMKVSLGMRTGGLFATDDELARRVLAAGERAGERWWRMPLADVQLADTSLADAVRGQLADVRQTPAGPPGITA
ncbi:MAG: leucyl aminopeptidase family protein, partial [Sciscionella sp.]|nr:leucyl aminopeptidase family protein [Sciscionella sp.]